MRAPAFEGLLAMVGFLDGVRTSEMDLDALHSKRQKKRRLRVAVPIVTAFQRGCLPKRTRPASAAAKSASVLGSGTLIGPGLPTTASISGSASFACTEIKLERTP